MEKGNETAKIYEAYKSLFSLPSRKKILALNLIQVVFFYLLLWVLGFGNLLNLVLIAIYYLVYFIMIRVLVFKGETTLDTRRTLGLSAITNGLAFFLFIIGLVLKNYSVIGYRFFSLLSVGFVAVITIMVVYTNAEVSFYKPLVLFLSLVIMLDLIQEIIVSLAITVSPILVLVQLTIYGLAIGSIIFIPLKLASHVGNLSGIELTRGFIFAWVLKKPSLLERVLKKFSLKRRVPMGFIRYRKIASGEELFVIISNIHPGPFLNVGSSNLPYLVNNWFRNNTDCEAIMLHGTCTHSENLPSSSEVNNLIIRLNQVRLNIPLKRFRGAVLRKHQADLTYTWQIINNHVFLFVTKSPKSMDDFHIDVGLLYRELMRSKGLDGLIIDSHNSLKEPSAMPLIKLEDEEAKQVISETKKFLSAFSEIEFSTQLRIGWANVKCDSITVEDGLGPGGIWAIYHDYANNELLLVIFDSNNLGTMVRDRIIEELARDGYGGRIEVLTTDTHVVNAVKPGSGGYRLLQVSDLGTLMPCIKKAVKKAVESADEAEVGVLIDEIDALMLGEENVNRLLLASLVGSKAFKLSLIIISLFSMLSLLLFSFIL